MKLVRIFLALVLSATMALGTGCTSIPALFESADAAGEAPTDGPAPAIWVMLVDLSGSTRGDRIAYLAAMKRILERVEFGDTVVVIDIGADSIRTSRYLVEHRMPAFTPKLPERPETDNPARLKRWEKACADATKAQREAFDRTYDIADQRASILTSLTPVVSGSVARVTEIFGAIVLGSRILAADPAPEKRLVIFSDMRDSTLDNAPLTEARMTKYVRWLDRRSLLPELHDVKVLVVGAGDKDPKLAEQIGAFWLKHYFPATGAQADPRGYGKQLSEILLDEWCAK